MEEYKMRTRVLALILCLIFALSAFYACAKPQETPVTPDTPNAPNIPDEPTVPEEPEIKDPLFTADTLPRLDGSTATIPLSEGWVSDLLGYTAEQAQDFVHHNTTHNAYVNLIEGKCDIIFVTPPSADELKMLEDAEENYKVVRVVKDAFVFLVNDQNPLTDLSLEDIKSIYRGTITNWSQVGGENVDIIPYQRPDNSGSQTLMYKMVLPDGEIMDAPTSLKPGEMGDLVDAVSDYTTGKGAIGYSVYYYASGMYVQEGSKLISVNGVCPTNETIANDSYPLIEGYYAVYREGDTNVEKLLDYILSENGQAIAERSGYVPLS